MDTFSFLQRVLPATGFYATLAIPQGRAPRQLMVDTVADVAAVTKAISDGGVDAYFSVASFKTKENRKQGNVAWVRSMAADIDCGPGKPYPTWREGLGALGGFLHKHSFPRPIVVGSGAGLHCYWVLDQELDGSAWQVLAEALKAALIEAELHIDPTVTADSSRVLRPICTMNFKRNAPVVLLADAPNIPVVEFCRAVAAVRSALQPNTPAGAPGPPAAFSGNMALNAAMQVPFTGPPADAATIVSKCQQIRWGVENQAQVPEPMWYAMLGVAAYTADPEGVAVAWSDQHPGFSRPATLRKMQQWKDSTTGPATCERFNQARAKGCDKCPFKDKITTPVRLGVSFLEIAPSADAPDQEAMVVPLPRGFKRTPEGIKYVIEDVPVDVTPFDIYPVSYGRDEGLGYEVCRFRWHRSHVGWQLLTLRQALLVDGAREFGSSCADQGIVLFNEKQTRTFQMMLRGYMDNLRKIRTLTNSYSTMGWKESFTQFVIGDRLISRAPDGTIFDQQVQLSSTIIAVGSGLYHTAGGRQKQINLTQLFQTQGLTEQYFTWLSSLASILLPFTGLKGALIVLCGDTGAGKTLAQLWAQSIWGDPSKLHFAAKFTQNALFGRMGMCNNLPVTIDEATILDPRDAGELVYMVTQGRDKARLGRNSEEKTAREWCMFMIASMNGSFGSKLLTSGQEYGAQRVRVLELPVERKKIFEGNSTGGRELYKAINEHYGHIGPEFVRRLLELGPSGVKAVVADAFDTFRARYHFQFAGEERYWESIAVLSDLAGRLAYDWGLTLVRPEPAVKLVLENVRRNRTVVIDQTLDAFDLVTEYLVEHAGCTVTLTHTDRGKPSYDPNRIPRGEIRVRIDLHRKDMQAPFDRGTVMIDRNHLRRWLAYKGFDIKGVVDTMAMAGAVCTPASGKATLTKNTPVKLPQVCVVVLNLNNSRLRHMLEVDLTTEPGETALEDKILGQLSVVK
jgi:hypothetical protein